MYHWLRVLASDIMTGFLLVVHRIGSISVEHADPSGNSLVQLGNAMTAMRRLSQFLIMEERADEVEKLPSPGAIITEGNFYWSEAPKAKVRLLRPAQSNHTP